MLNGSNAWVVSATAALLLVPVAGLARPAADPAVQAVADRVSRGHYQTYHLDVENMGLGLYGGAGYDMGYRNRDGWAGPGSLGNQEARLYLQEAFTAMGLSVSVQGSYLNVVGELTGTTTPENIYIVGAHYDHLDEDRPGGDDNASGTAGVLEAARVLSRYQFESTIRFIGFNAEEDSLAGSNDYVNNHVIPGGENIVGMINMDMILRPGSDVDPQTVIDAELEAQAKHPPSVAWAQAYQQAAADYVPSLVVNETIVDTESTSDNDSFLNAGYPAFLVIENSLPDFWDANQHYHTFEDASDRLANDSGSPSGVTYDFAFATDVTRAAVALIAQEAKLVPQPANVLMVMIDDLGWTDLHVQGNELLETPVIDRLAADGMRFTDSYSAAPVCSPTRAAIMTGQSPARLAITNHITGDQQQFEPEGAALHAAVMNNHLALEYVTLAERLREAGYANAFLGKWHISGIDDEIATTEPGRRPEWQGFDINIGGTSFGGSTQLLRSLSQPDDRGPAGGRVPDRQTRRRGHHVHP